MHVAKRAFFNDSNIGLYATATETYCIAGMIGLKSASVVETMLHVPVIQLPFLHTDFAGMFCKGNKSGLVLPAVLEEFNGAFRHQHVPAALYLETRYSAVGNLMLLNDRGVLLSPLLERHRKELGSFFNLPCAVTKIADTVIIGTAGVATNRGCLLHRDATQHQLKFVEKILGVPANIGTVNFGSPYVGAGILANSTAYVAGSATSGPELGRISETLGFV